MPVHPIFDDIRCYDMGEVKRRVLADHAVLEERGPHGRTPLIYAIEQQKSAIALWLIEHRGQHDLGTGDGQGETAFSKACFEGPLSVVKALVAADAKYTVDPDGGTPLMSAAFNDKVDVLAFLLQLPAGKSSIDAIDTSKHSQQSQTTALRIASAVGHEACVQLLLKAGADPTIPAGRRSPLSEATIQEHHVIVFLLRRAIAAPDRARCLHKARALFDAGITILKARQDSRDKNESPALQQQKAIAAAPVYLKGRVERDEPLSRVQLSERGDERLRATAAFVLGLEEGGVEYVGLPHEMYVDLLGYLLPAWADKGPNA